MLQLPTACQPVIDRKLLVVLFVVFLIPVRVGVGAFDLLQLSRKRKAWNVK
jgi:hypothetical protein